MHWQRNGTARWFPSPGLSVTVVMAATMFPPIAIAGAAQIDVSSFDFADVRLLDSPFRQASERNAQYLLKLDPDRLLHNTRKHAGLEPKGALYGGWESQGIAGHTLGHYLTALSQQFAASGDARFRQRIDYLVAEMAEAQRAYGDGYVGALPSLELETLRALKEGSVAWLPGTKGMKWLAVATLNTITADRMGNGAAFTACRSTNCGSDHAAEAARREQNENLTSPQPWADRSLFVMHLSARSPARRLR
jgi:hypothetical protein